MPRPETHVRAKSLALTATTLVAIAAMAAGARAGHGVPVVRAEHAVSSADSRTVRAVAAVVAAAARDLFSSGRTTVALAAVPGVVHGQFRGPTWSTAPGEFDLHAPRRLGVRLLDLPPPTR